MISTDIKGEELEGKEVEESVYRENVGEVKRRLENVENLSSRVLKTIGQFREGISLGKLKESLGVEENAIKSHLANLQQSFAIYEGENGKYFIL